MDPKLLAQMIEEALKNLPEEHREAVMDLVEEIESLIDESASEYALVALQLVALKMVEKPADHEEE